MPLALLDALGADDLERAGTLVPYRLPAVLAAADLGIFQLRQAQLALDSARLPWSMRAIVRRDDPQMVGYINFHGPPGVNDIAAPEAAELGWTVFPTERRRGYATEAARGLMTWATAAHGVRRFISSTTPDNAASLRVHEKLGFTATGEIVEGELIFELRR